MCLLFAIIKHWEISWEKINILSDLQKWFKRLNYHHQLLDRWNSILKKPSVSNFAPWVWPCFLNSASYFQSCYSTYIEMTRFLPHVMHSHIEYQCIFMWALNWHLFCCSRTGIATCAETGILESSDEAISIWMAVSFGQFWHLQGTNTLSAKIVKMKLKVSTTRCKIQTFLCVFFSWLNMYQIHQLRISNSIRVHEINTSGLQIEETVKARNWIFQKNLLVKFPLLCFSPPFW